MRYGLVASDYDSTLAPAPHGNMSPRTTQAIRLTRQAGALFAVITGRSAAGILFVLQSQDIDLQDLYIVAASGAEVADAASGQVLVKYSLDSSLIIPIEEITQAEGVEMLVHCGADIYTSNPTGFHAQREARVNGMNLTAKTAEELGTLVTERILVCGDPDRLGGAVARLRHEFAGKLEVHPSSPTLVEVTTVGVNKGRALRDLADRVGVAIGDTLAFGDNHNDIPLLAAAGRGVAVANAVPELLEVADDVIPACEVDGVAEYLEGVFG